LETSIEQLGTGHLYGGCITGILVIREESVGPFTLCYVMDSIKSPKKCLRNKDDYNKQYPW
jgi:hypothetical protein